MTKGGPTPLGEELAAFLRKHGLEDEVEAQSVVARWDEVVGPKISEAAQAVGVAQGVLFVEVRSSAWITELNFMRRELIARLNAGRTKGRIERIVFRLGEEEG